MQSLNDDERKEVLGEVLFDELQAIREYVQDMPFIKKEIREIKERITSVEHIVKAHEVDLRELRQQLA